LRGSGRVRELLSMARRLLRGERVGGGGYELECLREALGELRRKFPGKPESWLMRAAVRSFYVRRLGERSWLVEGIRELGDAYRAYRVYLSSSDGRYFCSCFTTSFGHARRRRVCTHIAAVIVWRSMQRLLAPYLKERP